MPGPHSSPTPGWERGLRQADANNSHVRKLKDGEFLQMEASGVEFGANHQAGEAASSAGLLSISTPPQGSSPQLPYTLSSPSPSFSLPHLFRPPSFSLSHLFRQFSALCDLNGDTVGRALHPPNGSRRDGGEV